MLELDINNFGNHAFEFVLVCAILGATEHEQTEMAYKPDSHMS